MSEANFCVEDDYANVVNSDSVEVECIVQLQRIMYPKTGYADGDFAIVSVRVKEEIKGKPRIHPIYKTMTLKGRMCVIEENAEYKVVGREVYDDKFNSYNYEVQYIQEVYSFNSVESQKVFLERILTDKQVGALYQAFDNPLEVIESGDVEALCNVKGVGMAKAEQLIEKYNNTKDYSKAYVELAQYNLTNNMIHKLVAHYGSPDIVVARVKDNPYILATEVDGIGFLKADQIAISGGYPFDSVNRGKAFILHFLEDQAQSGHSYMETVDLFDIFGETLGHDYPQEKIVLALQHLAKRELWHNEDKSIIALRKYYELERNIARHVIRLHKSDNQLSYDGWKERVKEREEKQGWQYSEEQLNGVEATLENNVVLISGYGGTGKTASVAGMLSVLGDEIGFYQCALSGKASVNMTEHTGAEGYTIHRLLGYNPLQGFTANEDNPLATDIIILDELSMVDGHLFLSLLKAIPSGAKLIMLGDTGQLESIGACNIMHDLMESGYIKCVTLTKVHRQASKSAIITKSIDVRNSIQIVDKAFKGRKTLGELQDLEIIGFEDSPYRQKGADKETINIMLEEFKRIYKKVEDPSQICAILPTKTRGSSCYKMNILLQKVVLPHTDPTNQRGVGLVRTTVPKGLTIGVTTKEPYTLYVGDRVINTKNDYQARYYYTVKNSDGRFVEESVNRPIFNGNMGTITDINFESGSIVVDFENIGLVTILKKKLPDIQLGYCITTHKSQGSGIPYVICGLDYSHYSLLTREMIYTMLTRSKKHCVFVFETKALRYATTNTNISYKRTFLPHFLQGNLNVEETKVGE